MLVFVDESGCTGFKFESGSSRLFTLVAVVLADDSVATEARAAVQRVRQQLGWSANREFKFNKTDKATRLLFLRALRDVDFKYYAFVLNKPALFDNALRKRDELYTRVVRWVFENALPDLRGATIVFDSCGERSFYENLDTYLRSIARSSQQHDALFKVRADKSHENDLLQVADMICGSVMRFYSDKADSRYYITPLRRKSASTRFWPPKMTRPAI